MKDHVTDHCLVLSHLWEGALGDKFIRIHKTAPVNIKALLKQASHNQL